MVYIINQTVSVDLKQPLFKISFVRPSYVLNAMILELLYDTLRFYFQFSFSNKLQGNTIHTVLYTDSFKADCFTHSGTTVAVH